MRRAGGYATIVDPEKATQEWDTFTCSHCNSIVSVQPMQDPSDMGGFCRMCMKHVCPTCAGGRCDPFEKKLERMESRERLVRAAWGS